MSLFTAIKMNKDFIRAYKRGKSAITPCIALYYIPNKQNVLRLGITVSKKIGGAVQRNRAKRIMRAAFAQIAPSLKPGYDYIMVARARAPYKKSGDIYAELCKIAKEHNLSAGA